MSIVVDSFAGQNWVIIPVALAVNESQPTSISGQKWILVLTGVCIPNLPGNNVGDWRRETLTINPDWNSPLQFAINRYSIPIPKVPGTGDTGVPNFDLDQWAPFAAISSIFDKDTSDAGFAVDVWRPTHFQPTTDVNGEPLNNIFSGIDVDVAVRNDRAMLHRVSYHITLVGNIVFVPPMQ
jgi:hypothetical protein